MFRKKVDENREILLQSFYNLEDRLTEKLGNELVTVVFTASSKKAQKIESLVNISHHLAEDGDRVLLVDANLRDNELARVTGSDKDKGFIDIIFKDYPIDDAVVTDPNYEDLDYIYTGDVASHADEYLDSEAIKEFYTNAHDRYDYVFINLTANIDIPEANMFAAEADGSVVFSSYDLSNSPQTFESIKQLEKENANILGIIITDYMYAEDEIDELFGGADE